jgi:hypothetical protein
VLHADDFIDFDQRPDPPDANLTQVIEMLVIPKAAVPQRDTAAPPKPNHQQPVLITEHQVKFATAAALGAPRPHADHVLHGLWQRLVTSVSAERRPPQHYPQRRYVYFEHAAMSREMDRL